MMINFLYFLGLFSSTTVQDTIAPQLKSIPDSVVANFMTSSKSYLDLLKGNWILESDDMLKRISFVSHDVVVFSDNSGFQKGQETYRYNIIPVLKKSDTEPGDFKLEIYSSNSINNRKSNVRIYDVIIHSEGHITLDLFHKSRSLKKEYPTWEHR